MRGLEPIKGYACSPYEALNNLVSDCKSSSTIVRVAWALALGARSILGSLALALRWGPLRELGIDATHGVCPSCLGYSEAIIPLSKFVACDFLSSHLILFY